MSANLPPSNHPRIVIIGGGFAGINLALKLKGANYQVLMLDKHNHHTFQPLLYQVATSGLEAGSIAYPLRKILARQANFHFRMAEVSRVNHEANTLDTSIGEISYDYLVIATGSTSNYFGMKDVEANSLPLKSVSEAIDMRHILLSAFEKALITNDELERKSLLTFVIAGGGPTGAELGGALSELKRRVLPKDYPELDLSMMRIIILDPGKELLSSMSRYAQVQADKYLRGFGVEIHYGSGVKSYDGTTAIMSNGSQLQCSTLIWAAGVMGSIPDGFDKAIIARGNRIMVDEFNKVSGLTNVFALGDAAQMADPRFERGLPMLSPVAIQTGGHLGKNFKKLANKEKMLPFKYWDKGSMATIGRNKAVVDLPNGRSFGGFFGWVTWLVVHLYYLIGFRNRAMVLADWTWSYITFDRRVRLIIRPLGIRGIPEPVLSPNLVKETA